MLTKDEKEGEAEATQKKGFEADEYSAELVRMRVVVPFILEMRLEEMVEAQSHAEAWVPMIDPTLFMKKGKDFAIDRAVTAALRECQKKLQKIVAEARG